MSGLRPKHDHSRKNLAERNPGNRRAAWPSVRTQFRCNFRQPTKIQSPKYLLVKPWQRCTHLGENLRHLAPVVRACAVRSNSRDARRSGKVLVRPQHRCNFAPGAFCSSQNLVYETFEILRSPLRCPCSPCRLTRARDQIRVSDEPRRFRRKGPVNIRDASLTSSVTGSRAQTRRIVYTQQPSQARNDVFRKRHKVKRGRRGHDRRQDCDQDFRRSAKGIQENKARATTSAHYMRF